MMIRQSWRPSYLPELTEYLVRGHSWDWSSWQATGRTFEPQETYVEPTPPEDFHMPNASYWPFVVALGLALFFAGFVFTWAMTFFGLGMMILGIWGWALQPAVGEADYA